MCVCVTERLKESKTATHTRDTDLLIFCMGTKAFPVSSVIAGHKLQDSLKY